MTKIKDDQNGGQPKLKTTKLENDQIVSRSYWKTSNLQPKLASVRIKIKSKLGFDTGADPAC